MCCRRTKLTPAQKAKKNSEGHICSLALIALAALIDVGLAAGTISKGPKIASFVGTLAGMIVLVCTWHRTLHACICYSTH